MDKALMDHNIDVSVCTQRAVCWIVRSAAAKVTTGEGGSLDKIIDGIASNTLLERLVRGTALQEAIRYGRRDKDCSVIYSKCPITQEAIQRIARNFMTGIV
ncbi:uncharacterized protein LOC110830136 [Zootermopsis nevadensis]|uniref:uncharacterized protein LOC110830136 n=1 Tax=Zootermopsis nevadensis TaxID=136037 RepID=UPI000B8EA0F3|nr:uncharacterized protein LOC110830136 [Zootermopsis nevadensis]